jgi:hypothetical protein
VARSKLPLKDEKMTEEGLLFANAQLSGSVHQHNENVNFAEKKLVEYHHQSSAPTGRSWLRSVLAESISQTLSPL